MTGSRATPWRHVPPNLHGAPHPDEPYAAVGRVPIHNAGRWRVACEWLVSGGEGLPVLVSERPFSGDETAATGIRLRRVTLGRVTHSSFAEAVLAYTLRPAPSLLRAQPGMG